MTTHPAGLTRSTVLPDMDFETYSAAGYYFDDAGKCCKLLKGKNGLQAVGTPAYSEHPSTESLCLSYDFKDGQGSRLWTPAMPPPQDLFDYLETGGLIEAWNCSFEWYIWNNVCVKKLDWPPLPYWQLRCAMAKARAFGYPGKLDKTAEITGVANQKLKSGSRLISKFSTPRTETKKDTRRRIKPDEDPADAVNLYEYCIGDIKTESDVSAICPDLSDTELEIWLMDQGINLRGMQIDLESLANCTVIIEQAFVKYTAELIRVTGGTLTTTDELDKMKGWIGAQWKPVGSLDKDHIEDLLNTAGIPSNVKRVLEIRQILGSASVKKLYALDRHVSADGRVRDLYAYYMAHTGRWAGMGPQTQNLPNSGPPVVKCGSCGKYHAADRAPCPWCGILGVTTACEWGFGAVQDALEVIATRDLATVEHYFGDPVSTVSGCLRSLFTSGPGLDLICSDYTAIEAVALAFMAGEEWRMEVFRTHGKIYEESASRITGVPFQEFMDYKERTGEHHPMRKKIGKFTELALGYQGWVGAMIAFGADEFLSEEEMKQTVIKWREDSPMIVAFWKGVENAAMEAVRNPGYWYDFRCVSYAVKDDVLYCRLPSGRDLCYHEPRITTVERFGKWSPALSYMGWNSDHKKGPIGWMGIDIYGGRFTENIVQAVCRDILAYGMLNVERAGYPVVLHCHDEPCSEVPEGFGSVEEYERILSAMPPWCAGWPIKAAGGWRGKRYRKD